MTHISKITIDYDILDLKTTVFKLIKNYIYARLKFGRDKVRAYVTSSRRGFRLEIEEKVDVLTNILERVLMDDDPYRIMFSLKRLAESGRVEDVDVAFYSKMYVKQNKENKIKEIDLENLLGSDVVTMLENTYGTKRFEEIVKNILDSVVDKLKNIVEPVDILYIVVAEDYRDEIIKEIINHNSKFKVYYNPYEPDKPIIRILSFNDEIIELVKKWSSEGKVTKYKVVKEYSKN